MVRDNIGVVHNIQREYKRDFTRRCIHRDNRVLGGKGHVLLPCSIVSQDKYEYYYVLLVLGFRCTRIVSTSQVLRVFGDSNKMVRQSAFKNEFRRYPSRDD